MLDALLETGSTTTEELDTEETLVASDELFALLSGFPDMLLLDCSPVDCEIPVELLIELFNAVLLNTLLLDV
jgi:hypothetical protein